jgi:ankyrin repeat protein
MTAACRDDVELLAQLLDRGADLELRSRDGGTALTFAAAAHDADAVRLLLDHGAVADDPDEAGMTPLMQAVVSVENWKKKQKAETVRALLDAGAEVNASNKGGESPLILAAHCGEPDIVETLVAAGADLRAKDNQGRTALKVAREKGKVEVAQLLLTEAWAPSPLVEVECICILPERHAQTNSLRRVLETCAIFAGSQVCSSFRIGAEHRRTSIFAKDSSLGAGVVFTWHVPEIIRSEIADATRSEWQELMTEIDRHGIGALLEARSRRT